ncbi:MAG: hypothetical protein RLZZ188_577 [Verrucomicrobiota bacterium]
MNLPIVSFMISSSLRFLGLLAAAVSACSAAEPDIIAKARAFLGTDEALGAVNAVRYEGFLIAPDPANPGKETKAAMEIIFQRPDRQRITARSEKMVEVTGLDGYEAWQRIHDPADPTKWRQTLLGPDQIKRLRANTWENLAYFRGIETRGGTVEDQGPAEVDGVACRKVAFIHGPGIIFFRYFEVATGRLVLTETEGGGRIREQGETIVNGIRFPKGIITVTKNAKGEDTKVTLTFEKITVNEPLPPKEFAVPAIAR